MSSENLGFIHRFIPAQAPAGQAGQSGPLATLLLLHGTGGDENALLDLGRMLAQGMTGIAMLSPRGKVLEHGMPRFFRRFAKGVFDVEDLKVRTHELADFVEAASAVYGFDPQRVIAVGFSNGANIAASMLLLRPQVLKGAVLFHPMVPFVPEVMPDLAGTPVFIGAGRSDPMVPQSNTGQLVELLKGVGADVTTFWQPGGHDISLGEVRAAKEWLERTL